MRVDRSAVATNRKKLDVRAVCAACVLRAATTQSDRGTGGTGGYDNTGGADGYDGTGGAHDSRACQIGA